MYLYDTMNIPMKKQNQNPNIYVYIQMYILEYIYIDIYISKEKNFGGTIANKERNKLLVTIPI